MLMPRLRVNAFSISIDGYGAGPDQALDNPMGVGGMALHQWVLGTKTFQKVAGDFAGSLIGDKVGREGVDDDFAARGFDNLGAWIMGRNMFAPSRGAWPDDGWKGWWGLALQVSPCWCRSRSPRAVPRSLGPVGRSG